MSIDKPGGSRPFVLLTNAWFSSRSGTQVVTADYARALARRGWRVAVYSPNSGPPAATELGGVAEVVSDLALLDRAPDLIHGHQHPPLIHALVRFPDTPAIQLCHDAVAWFDEAAIFDQIRRRAAVDALCRDRVAREAGSAAEAVTVLPNAVDLTRCRVRAPLPAQAKRVLIVGHHDGTHLAASIAACQKAGLEVATAGHGAGRPSTNLEAEMAEADIVIGAARIALEAMAVGCAVVVCDGRGLAGMVNMLNFDGWRLYNFGRALLKEPLTAEAIGGALAAYDPDDAAAVSRRVREVSGLEPAIDRLEAFYEETLVAHRAAAPFDRKRAADQLGAYLQRYLAVELVRSPWREQYEAVAAGLNEANGRLQAIVNELARRGLRIEIKPAPDAGAGAAP